MNFGTGEIQVRFVGDRISSTEKHLSELCQCFCAYTRKLARTRDTGDELANSVLRFAQGEKLNTTLQTALFGLADYVATVQDYRDTEVQRLEAKVVKRLAQYGVIAKQAKEDLRKSFEAQTQAMTRKQHLDRISGRYASKWQQIAQAESDLQRAPTTTLESDKSIEYRIESFEQHKNQNLQEILLDFINIELLFHTKAVEIFSKAYGTVAAIDQEQDLEEFRSYLGASALRSSLSHSQFRSMPDIPSMSAKASLQPTPATLPGRHSMRATSQLPRKKDSEYIDLNDDSNLTDSEDEPVQENLRLSSPSSSKHKPPRRAAHQMHYN